MNPRFGIPNPKVLIRASLATLAIIASVEGKAQSSTCHKVGGMPNACPGRSIIDSDHVTVTLVSPKTPPRCSLPVNANDREAEERGPYTCKSKEEHEEAKRQWQLGRQTWSIYYTLDGSTPSKTNGTAIASDTRINIEAPKDKPGAILKMIAYSSDGSIKSRVSTHTYVFANQLSEQDKDIYSFPSKWGNYKKSDDFVSSDYQMDRRVTSAYSKRDITAALKSLPIVSITMPQEDLFDPGCGIYMNPQKTGTAEADDGTQSCSRYKKWERRASMELIKAESSHDDLAYDGKHEPGTQIEGAFKIQGGSSRAKWKSKKLSMRIKFKESFGAKTFEYPVVEDASATKKFDTLVFDAHLNYALSHGLDQDQREKAHYLGDSYVADLMNLAGNPAPHSNFYNLFLNGVYWGVYDVHERPDESFAEAYLGGQKEDYDVVKKTSGNLTYIAGDKSLRSWNQLWDAADKLKKDENYQRISQQLDIDAFIRYMLINFYAANEDWPRHNWYAAINRTAPGSKWQFFSWDAEKSMARADYKSLKRLGKKENKGGPGQLFDKLWENKQFRSRVEAVWSILIERGPLMPNIAKTVYSKRRQELSQAYLLESARWGDAYNHDDDDVKDQVARWQELSREVQDGFLDDRRIALSDQLDEILGNN